EDQCEKACILGITREPVAIGYLERFLADYELQKNVKLPKPPKGTGYQVAIVGSGPAGMTAAGELLKCGFGVTIFEALHQAGGVLMYGIPEFRLPKNIVQAEVEGLKKLGGKLKLNHIIGKILTVDELLTSYDFDSVFIGTGAGLPKFLDIPGMNLLGVYSANEFLTRVNLMKAYKFPGGGNVAMDSARTALRLGSPEVSIVYRRTEDEMPARLEERENAKEEGIQFNLLEQPIAIHGDSNKRVRGVECLKCKLGEPGSDGRRRPQVIQYSEHKIDADIFICAVGQNPNPLIPQTTPGLKVTNWGGIIIDPQTGATSKKRVYAGGDIVTGAATVIQAMGAGKIAATTIMDQLEN
ncbi:MAG: FAD-dependent oxidoreductase, partial [Candidatus Ranarchaeia archaeon]